MNSMLTAELIGRVGVAPKKKEGTGRDGKPTQYVQFSVAHNYNDNDTPKTLWIVCFWNGRQEGLLERITVGAEVFVRGRLSTRIYIRDNVPQVSLSLSVTELKVLHGPPAAETAATDTGVESERKATSPDGELNASDYHKSFNA